MSRLRAVLFTLLSALVATASGADKSRDDEMVCVPAADGRSWECGTRAKPPPERGLADAPRSSVRSTPPPPFLAAPRALGAAPERPARPPPDAFAPAPARTVAPVADSPPSSTPQDRPAVAVAQPSTPASADAGAASMASAPAAIEQPAAVPVSAPPPLLAAPRQRLSPYAPVASAQPALPPPATAPQSVQINTLAESRPAPAAALEPAQPAAEAAAARAAAAPEPAASTIVAEASSPASADAPIAAPPETAASPEPAVASAAPEPVAAADESPPPSNGLSRAVALRDGAAFLQLPPTRFTLQLARAAGRDDALALAQQLGLAAADAALFAVPVEIAGSTQWLLLYSHFTDAESARAAWQAAATVGAKPAAYPRRIGPLQAEVRRSPNFR